MHPGCPRCFFRGSPCLCPDVPAISARLQIVVLRHAAEAGKQTNSARWAALALGFPIIDYAMDATPFDPASLQMEGSWLLFPGGDPVPPATPPRRLIVPDGTWPQARRMVQRVPGLAALPRLAIPPPPANPKLRQASGEGWVSTLEAIAEALSVCGEPGPAQALRDLHAAVLRRSERSRRLANWR